MAELRQNTWTTDAWYDQYVAGTTGGYQWGGSLWSWGYNRDGSLGLNGNSRTFDRSSPTQVGTDSDWKWISGGGSGYNVWAGKKDGSMWGWGKNESGMNAYNLAPVSGARSSPLQIGTDTTWKWGTMGVYASIALKTDGTLWTTGYNFEGMLGQNSQGNRISSPAQVGTGTDWKQIEGGRQVMGGIKTDGTMWLWGTGSGMMWVNNTPLQVSSPTQMPGTTWKKLACGQYTSAAIKTDGTLWTWGDNNHGTLGLNKSAPSASGASSPIQVGTETTWDNIRLNKSGDFRRAMAIKTDGSLWVWGSGGVGELGLNEGGTKRYSSPTQVPGTWATADDGVFDSSVAETLTCEDVTAVKRADDTYYIWGRGVTYGGLGLNDQTSRSSPTQLPGTYVTIKGGYGSGQAIKQ